MTEGAILKATLSYIEDDGVPVFLWKTVGGEKKPLIKGGHNAASRDPLQIREWFQRWPDANVGMPNGVLSGFLTSDIDRHNGQDGGITLDYYRLPLDGACLGDTPRNGRHAHWRTAGNVLDRLAGDNSPLANIDLLGEGGWVALPVPGSGYRFTNGPLRNAAPIPEEWRQLWVKPPRPVVELGRECKLLAVQRAPGRRNLLRDLAFKWGHRVAAGKIDEQTVRDRLWIAALATGLDHAEIGKTIDDGIADASDKAGGSQGKPRQAPPPDMATLERSAAAIIAATDVLAPFGRAVSHAIAGEQASARLLYLIATSRLFSQPMHVAVKGESAGGKSQLRKAVLSFFPPEDIISFTAMSERALLYFPDDLGHKILSMGEAAGVEEQQFQDYLLRELMSEGLLRYPVAQKIGGEIVTTVIEKKGPVCFFVTTTKDALHHENETRMLSMEIDDSEGQTRAVLLKLADIVGANALIDEAHLEPWRDFQRWLAAGNRRVVIPYAGVLADLTRPKSVRMRRDFVQLLDAIKAHALIHRNRRSIDGAGQIVADIEHDYAAARMLMADILAVASETKIRKTTQTAWEAVKALQPEPPLKDNHNNILADQGVTAAEVGKHLDIDRSAAWRRLRTAELADLVMRLGHPKSRQQIRYRTVGDLTTETSLVPDVETLRDAFDAEE